MTVQCINETDSCCLAVDVNTGFYNSTYLCGPAANKTVGGGDWITNTTKSQYYNNSIFACDMKDLPNSGPKNKGINLFKMIFGSLLKQ